jgi:hypothetical protein
MLDFRIELNHHGDGVMSWQWTCYDPRSPETTMHNDNQWFDSPGAALASARAYLANKAADRFIR